MSPLDISQDWRIIDGGVQVTYTSTRFTGSVYDNIVAFPRQLSSREQEASDAAYVSATRLFNVPASQFASGFVPKEGDTITDPAGTVWTVLHHDLSAFDQWWDLTGLSLAIAYDLQDMIQIQRAAISYDAAGAVLKLWPDGSPKGGQVLYPSMLANVQALTAEIVEERGIRDTKITHAVQVSQQIQVTNQDRIKATKLEGVVLSQPIYLEIRGYHNPDRIDELSVLDCELLP